jgi:hypothetical protein
MYFRPAGRQLILCTAVFTLLKQYMNSFPEQYAQQGGQVVNTTAAQKVKFRIIEVHVVDVGRPVWRIYVVEPSFCKVSKGRTFYLTRVQACAKRSPAIVP